MQSKLLTLSAITLVALAGCADDSGLEDTQATEDTDGTGTDGGQNATAEQNATNAAPSADLSADALNGTAPLAVNFTIDGSDADGDDLTWELSLNGTVFANGTELPGVANTTFEAAGNFTVFAAVSDGTNVTTANVTISVTQAVPSGPCGGEAEPCVVDEDTWVLFFSDGTCHMKDEYVQSDAGGLYINDRNTGTTGAGLIEGGGTWVYEESNGVDGMQIGGSDEAADYVGCEDPDTLIF